MPDADALGHADPNWYAHPDGLNAADRVPVTVPNGDPYPVRYAYAYADAVTQSDPDGQPFIYAHAFGYAYGLAHADTVRGITHPDAELVTVTVPDDVLDPQSFTDVYSQALDQYADWIDQSSTVGNYSAAELDAVNDAAHAYAVYRASAAYGR